MRFKDPLLIDDRNPDAKIYVALASRVELHKAPRWLGQKCRAYLQTASPESLKNPYGIRYTAFDLVKMVAERFGPGRWIDHSGTVEESGKRIFVSEPYDLHIHDTMAIMQFCESVGAEFYITATSDWYPTRTLRVGITDKL